MAANTCHNAVQVDVGDCFHAQRGQITLEQRNSQNKFILSHFVRYIFSNVCSLISQFMHVDMNQM